MDPLRRREKTNPSPPPRRHRRLRRRRRRLGSRRLRRRRGFSWGGSAPPDPPLNGKKMCDARVTIICELLFCDARPKIFWPVGEIFGSGGFLYARSRTKQKQKHLFCFWPVPCLRYLLFQPGRWQWAKAHKSGLMERSSPCHHMRNSTNDSTIATIARVGRGGISSEPQEGVCGREHASVSRCSC